MQAASTSLAIKIFPMLIQYFEWDLLDLQNKPTVRAKTSAQYVHMPLKNNGSVSKNIVFSGITVIQFLKG
jgi:hypothetical protein